MEITLVSWAISTSVIQRYKIWVRNANPLTLVNTNIISHFSSFFGSENGGGIMNYFSPSDYTETVFPRDTCDTWRHVSVPHGNSLICLIR